MTAEPLAPSGVPELVPSLGAAPDGPSPADAPDEPFWDKVSSDISDNRKLMVAGVRRTVVPFAAAWLVLSVAVSNFHLPQQVSSVALGAAAILVAPGGSLSGNVHVQAGGYSPGGELALHAVPLFVLVGVYFGLRFLHRKARPEDRVRTIYAIVSATSAVMVTAVLGLFAGMHVDAGGSFFSGSASASVDRLLPALLTGCAAFLACDGFRGHPYLSFLELPWHFCKRLTIAMARVVLAAAALLVVVLGVLSCIRWGTGAFNGPFASGLLSSAGTALEAVGAFLLALPNLLVVGFLGLSGVLLSATTATSGNWISSQILTLTNSGLTGSSHTAALGVPWYGQLLFAVFVFGLAIRIFMDRYDKNLWWRLPAVVAPAAAFHAWLTAIHWSLSGTVDAIGAGATGLAGFSPIMAFVRWGLLAALADAAVHPSIAPAVRPASDRAAERWHQAMRWLAGLWGIRTVVNGRGSPATSEDTGDSSPWLRTPRWHRLLRLVAGFVVLCGAGLIVGTILGRIPGLSSTPQSKVDPYLVALWSGHLEGSGLNVSASTVLPSSGVPATIAISSTVGGVTTYDVAWLGQRRPRDIDLRRPGPRGRWIPRTVPKLVTGGQHLRGAGDRTVRWELGILRSVLPSTGRSRVDRSW